MLDIETVQAPREEWARLAGRQLTCGAAAFVETGGDLFAVAEAEALQRLDEELYEKSSFDGTFSKIVCIGLLEFSDNRILAVRPPGTVRMNRSCCAGSGPTWRSCARHCSLRTTASISTCPLLRSARSSTR